MKKSPIAIALGAMFVSGVALAAADFAGVDANADGQATMEEVAAAAPEVTEEKFKMADANGDGVLTAEEYAAAVAMPQ